MIATARNGPFRKACSRSLYILGTLAAPSCATSERTSTRWPEPMTALPRTALVRPADMSTRNRCNSAGQHIKLNCSDSVFVGMSGLPFECPIFCLHPAPSGQFQSWQRASTMPSKTGDCFLTSCLFPQPEFLNFSSRSFRHSAKHHSSRAFEVSQTFATESDDVSFTRLSNT